MQRLELTWIGKNDEPRLEPRILLENPEYRTGRADANGDWQGMLIHGDNLLALKALEQDFAGKVKCIYIDPPYNTGSAFEHYDDGIEHSLWLSLIRDRLKILKNLLREDGSIWISIDDNECHYLKVLCDEVFGRGNFVANVVWQKRTSPESRLFLGAAHDHILVYAKNVKQFSLNKNDLNEEQISLYKNPDNDSNGPWVSTDFTAQGYRPNQMYVIETPSGTKYEPPPGRCWSNIEPEFNKLRKNGRIWFGANGNTRPRVKTYLIESDGIASWTWWANKDVGHNQEAKKETITLFGADNTFDTPKPERLLNKIIYLSTSPGDIVIDSFLGSGTTAAVAHKMNRRWIGIELGEHARTHCLPRLRKVVTGEDQGGISKSVGWQGGGGFRYYSLAPSLLRRDPYGQWVISPEYDAQMLAAAVAKHEGFRYEPDAQTWWKQSRSSERDWLLVTTQYVNRPLVDSIQESMAEGDTLLICCKAFDQKCGTLHPNITLKKIPNLLVNRCEFGRDDYSMHIVNVPVDIPETDDWLPDPAEDTTKIGRNIARQSPDNQQGKLF